MQQVIEDLAVEIGLFPVVAQEGLERSQGRRRRRPRWPCDASSGAASIAHAQGQLAQLLVAVRQAVRLQVEQQLQAVLGLAQEAIGVVEDAVFLIGQAADASPGPAWPGGCCAGAPRAGRRR